MRRNKPKHLDLSGWTQEEKDWLYGISGYSDKDAPHDPTMAILMGSAVGFLLLIAVLVWTGVIAI